MKINTMVIMRYMLILTVALWTKTIGNYTLYSSASFNEKTMPIYKDINYVNKSVAFQIPAFANKKIDTEIKQYINKNGCTKLDYNIQTLTDNYTNIFLDCGNPENLIYDFKNEKFIYLEDLLIKKQQFVDKVKYLLNLKYPNFVTEEVDILNGRYNIQVNQLTGYYKTLSYGTISIIINNNEIKNMLTYDMQYDVAYLNETYTLDPNKKTVAFTFDDGPSTYDNEIIDTLVNAHANATFFLVGNRLSSYKTVLEKMVTEKMEVGNHTYDHKSLVKLKQAQIDNELTKTNQLFNEMTSSNMNLIRPPYGSINNKSSSFINYPIIIWSLDTLDWKYRDTEKVYNAIMNNIKDGDIVLMHSLYETTSEAVKRVLPELYKQGYQVVSVSTLASIKNIDLNNGKRYYSIN